MMNRMWILPALVLAYSSVSCTQTIYHKQVVVQKNAQGEIEKIQVTEEITQPYRDEKPNDYKYINH